MMQEEYVVCRRCGRDVPKTMYCIYCGTALSDEKSQKIEAPVGKPLDSKIESTPPMLGEEISDDSYFRIPGYLSEAQAQTPSRDEELDPETVQLLEELRKHQTWKVRLCSLLAEDRVSGEVFTKVYEEYAEEFGKLDGLREEKASEYREKYDEKKAELDSIKREHEELRVRVAVGQIPESELVMKTPEMAEGINSLSLETNELETKLSLLDNFMGGVLPRQAFELDKMARSCIESLDDFVKKKEISVEIEGKIREDLRSFVAMLESVLGDKKEREKELMEELDTLEAQYKVGEITLSEFESLKRGILIRREQIWA